MCAVFYFCVSDIGCCKGKHLPTIINVNTLNFNNIFNTIFHTIIAMRHLHATASTNLLANKYAGTNISGIKSSSGTNNITSAVNNKNNIVGKCFN